MLDNCVSICTAFSYALEVGNSRRSTESALDLRGADLAERLSPLTDDYVAVELLLLLSPDSASSAESPHLAVLADGNRSAAPLFAACVPGHLVNFVEKNLAVLAFVFLNCPAYANNSRTVTGVVADDNPVSSRLAQFLFQAVPSFNRFLQRIFFATVLVIAQKLRLGNVSQSYPYIPANRLVLWAVNPTYTLMSALCHESSFTTTSISIFGFRKT